MRYSITSGAYYKCHLLAENIIHAVQYNFRRLLPVPSMARSILSYAVQRNCRRLLLAPSMDRNLNVLIDATEHQAFNPTAN